MIVPMGEGFALFESCPEVCPGGGCIWMKFIAALMCTVASPDPNPNGRGQLPNPNECNSTLTNATKGETLYY